MIQLYYTGVASWGSRAVNGGIMVATVALAHGVDNVVSEKRLADLHYHMTVFQCGHSKKGEHANICSKTF